MFTIILSAYEETLSMILISGILAVLLGLPLGFLLYGSTNKQFCANKLLYYAFHLPITLINSTPYLLITIFSFPLLKFLVENNTPNATAAIVPLTIAAIPYYSLLTFDAIKKLPTELLEIAKTLGASPLQAILKIYIPEMLPTLVNALGKTLIQLISYSTIAGVFGAGGLGYLLMQKGYYSFELSYVVICTLLLVCTTQLIQYSSRLIAKQLVRI